MVGNFCQSDVSISIHFGIVLKLQNRWGGAYNFVILGKGGFEIELEGVKSLVGTVHIIILVKTLFLNSPLSIYRYE